MKKLILMILAFPLVVGAAEAKEKPTYYKQIEESEQNSSESDRKIASSVKKLLDSDWLSNGQQDFSIDISNGTIFLRGNVDSEAIKKRIEEATKKIEGVTTVSNELTVKQGDLSEEEIRKEIKNALSDGWFSKSFQNVAYDIVNGDLTIKGSVPSKEERARIEERLKKINGVHSINNKLIVVEGETELSEKIYNILNPSWFSLFSKSYPNVSFENKDGAITLNGIVEKEEDKRRLEIKIKKLKGVISIENNLSVKAS